jgi:hypothetical protein
MSDPRLELGARFDRYARAKFLDLVAQGHSRTGAAKRLGFQRRTITNRMHRDPEFAAAVLEAEGEILDEIESVVMDRAKKGHIEAAKFVLERRDPIRWGPLSARRAMDGPVLDATPEELGTVAAELIRQIIDKETRAAEAQPVIDVESTEADDPVPPVPAALPEQSDILGDDIDWDSALG